ncbi:kynurenine formamidase [Drosophila bipectinata]|uniref:kynurenine formamidase n=1 Tax=Drosophila bipectinata TaxID=42026 RepID=UPI001C8A41DB|nr:kynurenine formamidase [Drosophila bipectinata]XP_017095624.2 kynurenine formamidase [Drosophila bipectinata]
MYNPESEDLSKEYFPSHNTLRFQDEREPNVAVLDNFIRITQQHEEALANQGIQVDHRRYGPDRQVVDVFYSLKNSNDAPLFVFIHGGYWQMLDKSNSCSMVGPYVRRGYRVAVMDYNLCPDVTLGQLMEEFRDFLGWVFDYAEQCQSKGISFAGHSAGAHLLAEILKSPGIVTLSRARMVTSLIFMCGVYDLRELWNLEAVNPKNILGIGAVQAEALSPILWEYHEIENWMNTTMHVIVAEHDSITFIEQSRRFADVLKSQGFTTNFKIFKDYDHFDIIEETFDDKSRISQFLRSIEDK